VRAELGNVLDGAPTTLPDGEVERAEIAALTAGELGRFLDARQGIVTSLAAEVRAAVEAAGDSRFVVMDMAGAAKGYATGAPTGAPAPASAWREGIDPAAVAGAGHGLGTIGYAREPARLRLDLDAYHALVPPDRALSVALRPMHPDCDGPANLRAKIDMLREGGVAWADFYHYGFMRLDALDWINEALHGGG